MYQRLCVVAVLLFLFAGVQTWAHKSGSPQRLIKLIGRTRPEVDRTLGKPTRIDNQVGGGLVETWGSYPKATQAYWNTGNVMTTLSLPSASTWQKTLKKYGLSTSGVHATKTEGDGGSVAYKLTGIKGIPKGWNCIWFDSGLSFDKR